LELGLPAYRHRSRLKYDVKWSGRSLPHGALLFKAGIENATPGEEFTLKKSYDAWLQNGSNCNTSGDYSPSLPADGAAKCIRITGFAIPKNHKAKLQLKFEIRGEDVDHPPDHPGSEDELPCGVPLPQQTARHLPGSPGEPADQ
jgi:hypothetical protein